MDQLLDKYIFPYTGRFFGWAKKTPDGLPAYTRREEKLNCLTHIPGVLIGLGMAAAALICASSPMGLAGGLIFSLTLVLLYLNSCVYHGAPPERVRLKKLLRMLDHCSIFVLVAGTCSPFVLRLIELSGDWTEWIFYAVIWLLALGGIAMLSIDMKRYKSLTIAMYFFTAVLLVFRVEDFAAFLSPDGVALFIAGGAAYLTGFVFYALGSKHEWFHSAFHVFCLIGSALHCACIAGYVI